MDIDTIKVEAHYSAILNERCQMILNLQGQVEALAKENAELKAKIDCTGVVIPGREATIPTQAS
jgi:hypothetical protein